MVDILLNKADADDQFTIQEIADEVITILFAVGITQFQLKLLIFDNGKWTSSQAH